LKVAALAARYCQGEAAPISVAIVHQYPASVSDWEPSVVAENAAIQEIIGNCRLPNARRIAEAAVAPALDAIRRGAN
jgi:hypothetical protein